MWDDENYYLVAYDAEEEIIKRFRVDKKLNDILSSLDLDVDMYCTGKTASMAALILVYGKRVTDLS